MFNTPSWQALVTGLQTRSKLCLGFDSEQQPLVAKDDAGASHRMIDGNGSKQKHVSACLFEFPLFLHFFLFGAFTLFFQLVVDICR